MARYENERIEMISRILEQKAISSRNFTQYEAQRHSYGPEDTLHLREAHFIMTLGLGEGKTMSELAQMLSVTKGAVSQTAGRLEKKGYLCRRQNPSNHRLVIAALTEKGKEFYQRHWEFDSSEYARMDREHLSQFSNEELSVILEYEKSMITIFLRL